MSIGYCDRSKIEDIATTIRNACNISDKLTLAQINTKLQRIITDSKITELIWEENLNDYVSNNKFDLSGMCLINCTTIGLPAGGESTKWRYFTSVDFTGTITNNLTSLRGLFWSCSELETIDFSTMDLSKVTDMYNLFNNCGSLVNLYNFTCESAENMEYCFGSTLFSELPINEAPKATNIKGMFNGMNNITSATFSAPLATDCSSLFLSCNKLTTANLNLPEAIDIGAMFARSSSSLQTATIYAPKATTVSSEAWDGETYGMFQNCSKLESVDLTLGALTTAQNLFYPSSMTKLSNIKITFAQAGTCASYLFASFSTLPTFELNGTSNLVDTSYMFKDCTGLTSVPTLDLANVTNTSYMFYYCTGLTSVPTLDLPNVTNTSYMFKECTGLTSVPTLDLPNVTNTSYMFNGCTNLQSFATSSTQNTVKTTSLSNMFNGCSNLTSVDLTQLYVYTTDQTIDSAYFTDMFTGCTSLTTLTLPTNFGYWYWNSTTSTAYKTSKPTLDLSSCPLTHDSCLDVFNKLGARSQVVKSYSYSTPNRSSIVAGTLYLSDATYDLMTADEIAIATAKNWTVSKKTTT